MSVNVWSFLQNTSERLPEQAAVIDLRGTMTFESLRASAAQVSDQLVGLGLCPGERVAFISENGRSFLIGLFAILKCGAVAVPMAPNRPPAERLRGYAQCAVSWVLSAQGRGDGGSVVPGFAFERAESETFRQPDAMPRFVNEAVVRPTSGTTGASKGVVLSHESVFERTAAAIEAFKLSEADRICWVMPMAHHFVVTVLAYVRVGATIVVTVDHLAESILKASHEHKCTILYAAPLHYGLLAQNHNSTDTPYEATPPSNPFVSLRFAVSTSAPLGKDVAWQFEQRFGVSIAQVFGSIELGLPLGERLEEGPRSGVSTSGRSVGSPLSGFKARIVNNHDQEVSPGEVGELLLKGPGMFDGYLSPFVPRAGILRDGFFATGDLASVDSEGRIYIRGRKKSVMIVAGHKVFPEEVEEVLEQCPGIVRAKAYSEPHSLTGEVVVAQVELDRALAQETIIGFCRKRLAGFKVPQRITFQERIAVTATGKTIRASIDSI